MLASHLDSPKTGDPVYAQSISIAGWFHPGDASAPCCIRAWIGGELIGETDLLFVRPDVCTALHLPAGTATGFRILACSNLKSDEPHAAEIVVTASRGKEQHEIGRCAVTLHSARLAERPYGEVLHPAQACLLHRENIYGSGPPVERPGGETLYLIEQYLPARSSVLDVGCGAGAYGPHLRAAGYKWLGLEVSEVCCALLSKHALPFRRSDAGQAFPVRDGEFDAAICIEVLEHIDETEAFLHEMARSIRGRALFSVPNLEVIPYFSAWQVVPWHLLEADHKNFFTRASLRALLQKHFRHVEVFSYAEHPLRTPEGLPLHVHLFAIADKA